MLVRGRVGYCEINYLLDTGSEKTLIDQSLVTQLKLTDSIRPTNYVLKSFTNDSILTKGQDDVDLAIAGICVRHTSIIVPDMECDILLGLDYMTVANISIHAGTATISTEHGSAPFLRDPTVIPKSTSVRASDTVIVPPNQRSPEASATPKIRRRRL